MLAAEIVQIAEMKLIPGLLFVSVAFCVTPVAASDAPVGAPVNASEAAAAESLYQEGRRLLAEGKYAEACAALEASHRLEPAVGALLNLGRCFELNGQLASAWSTFSEADALARKTNQAERAALARRERDRIWPEVPRLLITVESLDSDMRVLLDGDELTLGALGLPLAVDPGRHRVQVVYADGRSGERSVEIEGGGVEPTQVKLAAKEPPSSQQQASLAAAEGQTRPAPERKWSALKWSGLGAAVIGLGGAGVAVTMGIRAHNMANQAECDELLRCTEAGYAQRKDAQSLQNTARIVGISFGALSAVGLTVFFLAPESGASTTALQLEPRLGGAQARFVTAF